MDRVQDLRAFVRVAELASFTVAAEQLGLPKASASTAVKRLEEEMGVLLLQRTTRRVALTLEGRAFYERTKDLLADLDDMASMFQVGGDALTGRLRVDMPSSTARKFVIPRLPEFLDAHPLLDLELSATDRRVDPVREGFDCVLRVGDVGDVNLFARRLGMFAIVNCASPAYLARHGTPRTLADLAGHRLIHYVPGLGGGSPGFEYPQGDGYASLPMDGALTVNSAESYEAACLAGLGIVQTPEADLRPHLEAGRLVTVLPDLRPEPMPVTLLYPQRRHLPRRTAVFMEWLAEVLRPSLAPL
ncbi:LysR family transcriptional regulator [Alloalcanivorax gelatiniphagus]|uniref:LysR family transcriptional regulator n=1 Tax=Alloalcanivorax gelatiniphagus TaxID=1194167 RepID=A0ABY2XPV5_9GAMM|nr:LysR family transcriptional regulator [Alloalcanivorax gelatiniphagus]TMW14664.1 LysR family transcriptional regulator [Alloalcanivorax gelatiniphagus]